MPVSLAALSTSSRCSPTTYVSAEPGWGIPHFFAFNAFLDLIDARLCSLVILNAYSHTYSDISNMSRHGLACADRQ